MLSSRPKVTPYSLLSVWVMAARWQIRLVDDQTVAVLHPIACDNCAPKVLALTTWPPRKT